MINSLTVSHSIVLYRISYSDAEPLFLLIDQNRERLRNWLPFVDMTTNASQTEAFIGSLFTPHCREMVFTIRYHNETAGLIGFKDIDRINKKLEIGYWIAPQFEGKGIITKSVAAMIDAAFEKMEMNRVQICCGVGNIKSSNVPKRLNFRFEGIQRNGEWLNGQFIDLEVYSMLKNEWKKVV
ncbi:MAG: GNAT family N-acetyltransferase [Bacteroidales bacterium]|nr:GNAT family N-acetyltransferase [Bacteroidales bacterium]